jgi:protein TonB
MKRTSTLLLFLAIPRSHITTQGTAQIATDTIFESYDVQKMPSFPGGDAEMMRFIRDNLQYSSIARESNIQGTVALSFVVGKDGGITAVKVLKDIGGLCGKEATRVVNMMPKWTPGEANGHPVKVRFTLPIRFRLQ